MQEQQQQLQHPLLDACAGGESCTQPSMDVCDIEPGADLDEFLIQFERHQQQDPLFAGGE